MKKYRITYYGNEGTIYSVLEEIDDYDLEDGYDLESGDWQHPFPNKKGNSTALGLWERVIQSDYAPIGLLEEGINRIKCELMEDTNE